MRASRIYARSQLYVQPQSTPPRKSLGRVRLVEHVERRNGLSLFELLIQQTKKLGSESISALRDSSQRPNVGTDWEEIRVRVNERNAPFVLSRSQKVSATCACSETNFEDIVLIRSRGVVTVCSS